MTQQVTVVTVSTITCGTVLLLIIVLHLLNGDWDYSRHISGYIRSLRSRPHASNEIRILPALDLNSSVSSWSACTRVQQLLLNAMQRSHYPFQISIRQSKYGRSINYPSGWSVALSLASSLKFIEGTHLIKLVPTLASDGQGTTNGLRDELRYLADVGGDVKIVTIERQSWCALNSVQNRAGVVEQALHSIAANEGNRFIIVIDFARFWSYFACEVSSNDMESLSTQFLVRDSVYMVTLLYQHGDAQRALMRRSALFDREGIMSVKDIRSMAVNMHDESANDKTDMIILGCSRMQITQKKMDVESNTAGDAASIPAGEDYVHVGFSVTPLEIVGFFACAASILSNSMAPQLLRLHVITVKGRSCDYVRDAIRTQFALNSAAIKVYCFDPDAHPIFAGRTEVDVSNFIRFYAHELLPASVEKLIWLDVDIIVLGDLRFLYERAFIPTGSFGNALVACVETFKSTDGFFEKVSDISTKKAMKKIGMPERSNATSFNAGVTVFNLKTWRRRNMTAVVEDIEQRLIAHNYASFRPDHYLGISSQIPLVFVTYERGSRQDLPMYWNRESLGFSPRPDRYYYPPQDLLDNKILHWSGPYKPWAHVDAHHYRYIWQPYLLLALGQYACGDELGSLGRGVSSDSCDLIMEFPKFLQHIEQKMLYSPPEQIKNFLLGENISTLCSSRGLDCE